MSCAAAEHTSWRAAASAGSRRLELKGGRGRLRDHGDIAKSDGRAVTRLNRHLHQIVDGFNDARNLHRQPAAAIIDGTRRHQLVVATDKPDHRRGVEPVGLDRRRVQPPAAAPSIPGTKPRNWDTARSACFQYHCDPPLFFILINDDRAPIVGSGHLIALVLQNPREHQRSIYTGTLA